jgi:hypothetical protein
MESQEREDMRISPATIRRLRLERGWSQEQLAMASGVSLRTIQRVEAVGAASMETWTCLAAALGVERSALARPLIGDGPPDGVASGSLLRYKIAIVFACLASVPAILGIENIFPTGTMWSALASVAFMLVIALLLYSGLGWYFGGSPARVHGIRRVAGTCCIAIAIFCVFSTLALLTAANS